MADCSRGNGCGLPSNAVAHGFAHMPLTHYSYHPVLCTPLFLCTVAIFECNSLLFNVKQVVFYRDMSEVQFELVISLLDDVNRSVGPDDAI
jgi:hypothetical protein